VTVPVSDRLGTNSDARSQWRAPHGPSTRRLFPTCAVDSASGCTITIHCLMPRPARGLSSRQRSALVFRGPLSSEPPLTDTQGGDGGRCSCARRGRTRTSGFTARHRTGATRRRRHSLPVSAQRRPLYFGGATANLIGHSTVERCKIAVIRRIHKSLSSRRATTTVARHVLMATSRTDINRHGDLNHAVNVPGRPVLAATWLVPCIWTTGLRRRLR
jgi:hypothetical protein